MRRTLLAMGVLLLATPNCGDDDKDFKEQFNCGGYGGMYAGTDEASSALSGSGGFGAASGNAEYDEPSKPLFAACEADDECESGFCPMGYCSMTCVTVHDCEPDVAECAPFADRHICMPVCEATADCERFGCVDGVCSECASTKGVDEVGVTVCADWSEPTVGTAE